MRLGFVSRRLHRGLSHGMLHFLRGRDAGLSPWAPRVKPSGAPPRTTQSTPTLRPLGQGPSRQRHACRLLSLCYVVIVSVNVSIRLDDRLAERLRLRASAAGETLSDRLRRYAEEGARRDEHPLITFRDGPTGRRAGLIGGPDVWEIAMWIDDLGPVNDPAADLISDRPITHAQIDAALAYHAAYPEEIQARIDLHRAETAAAQSR